ncbi:hypothetical protein [Streptomyces sp. GC420]|uniref:hypothetical protein n=1 Tax=Streptomyces sp. GC420 TaxID=2697568 RepID=UPI001414CE0A|nr:hypothetical protein [Streptomyces sp. GC420]NBM18450.1 hypothetical protein [Streptomyces sp. GC420]
MTASVLPRLVGSRTGAAAAVAALAVAGTTLMGASAAFAQGDNGDVKIHSVGTRYQDQRDESNVCKFYLAADNFDVATEVTYRIEPKPPRPNGPALEGTITLAGGVGQTRPLSLIDGQYKLAWEVTAPPATPPDVAATGSKVFTVDCKKDPKYGGEEREHGQSGSKYEGESSGKHGDDWTPKGGVPAGGGGLAVPAGPSQIGGAAAAGAVGVAGLVYFRRFRRLDGAA